MLNVQYPTGADKTKMWDYFNTYLMQVSLVKHFVSQSFRDGFFLRKISVQLHLKMVGQILMSFPLVLQKEKCLFTYLQNVIFFLISDNSNGSNCDNNSKSAIAKTSL